MTWQLHAACRDADPALFFPDGHDASAVVRQTVERFCRRCPVVVPCREAGKDEYGVWGGQIAGGGEGDHGTRSTFNNKGCRCRLCVDANNEFFRVRRRLSAEGAARLEALVDEYQGTAS